MKSFYDYLEQNGLRSSLDVNNNGIVKQIQELIFNAMQSIAPNIKQLLQPMDENSKKIIANKIKQTIYSITDTPDQLLPKNQSAFQPQTQQVNQKLQDRLQNQTTTPIQPTTLRGERPLSYSQQKPHFDYNYLSNPDD